MFHMTSEALLWNSETYTGFPKLVQRGTHYYELSVLTLGDPLQTQVETVQSSLAFAQHSTNVENFSLHHS